MWNIIGKYLLWRQMYTGNDVWRRVLVSRCVEHITKSWATLSNKTVFILEFKIPSLPSNSIPFRVYFWLIHPTGWSCYVVIYLCCFILFSVFFLRSSRVCQSFLKLYKFFIWKIKKWERKVNGLFCLFYDFCTVSTNS